MNVAKRISWWVAFAIGVSPSVFGADSGRSCPLYTPGRAQAVCQARPGPWGDLEIRTLYLEAPPNLIAAIKKPGATPSWAFPGAEEASVRRLFEQVGIGKEKQERLLDPQRVRVMEGALTLFPSLADLESLTREQRSIIYAELAKSPLNTFYRTPAYAFGGDVDDWLREARLSGEQKGLIKRLIWMRGDLPAFSDVSALLQRARSDYEVHKIFKFMTRARTLVVELKLASRTNLTSVAAYWSNGREAADTFPLLLSAAERESVASLDIMHLLPPIPRRLLYTFPNSDMAVGGRLPDCHWTSLNFFDATPEDYYLDSRLARNHINENYLRVDPPYRFGDVLIFFNPAGEAFHSCAYIADDIVLTKNGENMLKPWVLMLMPNLKLLYDIDGPIAKVQAYRLKSLLP